MKTRVAIISIIAAIVFLFTATGCIKGPVEVTRAYTCTQEDVNDFTPVLEGEEQFVKPTSVFPSGTKYVGLFIQLKNVVPEDKITIKWNYLETGKELYSELVDRFEKSHLNYDLFTGLYIDSGLSAGKYNVVIYLNDKPAKTVEFSVE